MAAKKKPTSIKKLGFGGKNLNTEISRAQALMARKKWRSALEILEPLHSEHPKNSAVLSHLAATYAELGDFYGCERVFDLWMQLAPNNADALYGLGGVYIINQHPLLAFHTLGQALDKFPDDQRAAKARETVEVIESNLDELLSPLNLSKEAGWEIAILHERGQAYLEQGLYQQARQAEEEVLRIKPDFLSAQNNLSLISYAEGKLDEAIAFAHAVLEQDADNVHALSNLIRFCCLNGKLDEAHAYRDQLKASQASAWDVWTKKVEGLAYLGDDDGILEVYEQAQASGNLENTLTESALFYHLVAVAMARNGDMRQAHKLWKQALQRSPGLSLAQDNLEDLKRPIGQRHAPWHFSLNHWLDRRMIDDLTNALQASSSSKDEPSLDQIMQQYLADHPKLAHLVPILLDRGDRPGREFALRLATAVKTPEMLQALKDFALSQWGPDSFRQHAAVIAVETELLPAEDICLYIKGEWQKITFNNYEFHDEPTFQHSRKVINLLTQALPLLKSGKAESVPKAEDLLRQAIKAEPDFPDLQNNLAVAYQLQGRIEEAQTLLQQIVDQYPDYISARASLARFHVKAGELEAAEALLKPLLSRKSFHYQDFATFSEAYVELLMAQDNLDAARGWLNLWSSVEPDHPHLPYWESLVGGKDLLDKIGKIANGELGRRPKSPKSKSKPGQ